MHYTVVQSQQNVLKWYAIHLLRACGGKIERWWPICNGIWLRRMRRGFGWCRWCYTGLCGRWGPITTEWWNWYQKTHRVQLLKLCMAGEDLRSEMRYSWPLYCMSEVVGRDEWKRNIIVCKNKGAFKTEGNGFRGIRIRVKKLDAHIFGPWASC